MKNYLIIATVMVLFIGCEEIGDNIPLLNSREEKQPVIIVNKNRHLNIAEFWIDRVKNPNKIIMDSKEIEEFNNNVSYKEHKLTYFKDMGVHYRGSWVKKSIEGMFNGLTAQVKYFEDGNRIPNSFFNKIKEYMNLKNIDSTIKCRYALTVKYTNQRVVPTELALLKNKEQIFFDRNQNSALDIATPIAILHTTVDGRWHYGIAPTSSGWIEDGDIAFGNKKEIQDYLSTKSFVVTTAAKSAVMLAGNYYDYLRMGVRLPSLLTVDNMTMVLIPTRDNNGGLVLSNATIKSTNLHRGYLPYTPSSILEQAFKFLNAPYGWGGSFGEQDCSKFIQEIYATVGIKIPRNSSAQSAVGNNHLELSGLSRDAKRNILIASSNDIGAAIVHLQGHIMLYIGDYKGEPYVIQTVWGESNRHYALGRTAVTSLNFNNYIDKIDRVTVIK